MPEIKQLFFDCDNTLVLSEDVAFEVCADLVNALLIEYEIPDRFTNETLLIEFIGLSFRGMMVALQKKYNFTMSPDRIQHYTRQEETAVFNLLTTKVAPCDGSLEVLEKLSSENKYGRAIVSSSGLRRINAAINTTGHDRFFSTEHVFSAASSLATPAPKPSPAVYIHAMEKMNVKPEQCVTVEDSMSGALSAIRANITCIAYVGAYANKAQQDQIAKTLVDLGCTTVMYHWSQYFDCLERIEQA